LANDVAIVFVQYDPQTEIDIEASAPLFYRWYLNGETATFGLLRGNWKKEDQVTGAASNPDANRDRSMLRPSVSPLSASRLHR
jgi:hypothetical protein